MRKLTDSIGNAIRLEHKYVQRIESRDDKDMSKAQIIVIKSFYSALLLALSDRTVYRLREIV